MEWQTIKTNISINEIATAEVILNLGKKYNI